MTNKIGEKIKYLRKKSNVTQEKFADYLGITFQAVSRWECGDAYPDLEILPSIANYFNVTTDELLGVDIMNKQEKINEIQKKVNENFHKGLIDENIAVLRIAVNEFPNDFYLLKELAHNLNFKEETKKESIEINERILRDCTDDDTRYDVMFRLAYAYKNIGEKEKAIQIANKLPHIHTTKSILFGDLYDGEEKIIHLGNSIHNCYSWLLNRMFQFALAKYTDDKNEEEVQKRIEIYKKIITIFNLMYEDENYGMDNIYIYNYTIWTVENYLLLQDFDNALNYLEKSADYAMALDILPENFRSATSIFQDKKNSWMQRIKDNTCSDSDVMLQKLSAERYDLIRETERFKAVVAKLEQYAKKET